ncbi:BRO family, N-terminal domain [Rhizobiales bacterium GAS113]|nr:BRO family, N-terminal domain [Rhizobiales bacterium GAS113]
MSYDNRNDVARYGFRIHPGPVLRYLSPPRSTKTKVRSVYIAAEHIRTIPWPGTSQSVRAVLSEGRVWFVAADLCRALEYAMSSNGKPNVTEALAGVSAEHRHFAAVETHRGTYRLALTSASGLITLAARQRAKSTGAVMPETSLHMWIAQAVADVASFHDSQDDTTAFAAHAKAAKASPILENATTPLALPNHA